MHESTRDTEEPREDRLLHEGADRESSEGGKKKESHFLKVHWSSPYWRGSASSVEPNRKRRTAHLCIGCQKIRV